MKKEGLYISLASDGTIKRHLSTDFGEVPLPDTTITQEFIDLTEYDQDLLVAEIQKIDSLAHQINDDPTNLYRFDQMVTAFLDKLWEKSPMWHTLLVTQFRDEFENTPYMPGNQMQNALFIADCLYQPRGAEITVNIVLGALCEERSCDIEEREYMISKCSATAFFTLRDNLEVEYLFRSAEQYYIFLLQNYILSKPNIAYCQHCGRLFVPKTRKRTLYCDRIVRDGKTCKQIAPYLTYKKKASTNRLIAEFIRVKGMLVRRVERAIYDKKPSLIDLNYDQYRKWLRSATDARDRYLAGTLTEEEAMAIIYVPKKDGLQENNSSEYTLANSGT